MINIFKYKEKLKSKIVKYCKTNYSLVNKYEMDLGKLLYNSKCHLNAVQNVKEGTCKEVYLCVCIEDNKYPFVHFINKNKDGRYIDNTLGWRYEQLDYYIIRQVSRIEYSHIWNVLTDTKEMLIGLYTNAFTRFIFRIKDGGSLI